jgi:hypothetical protein
MWNNWFLYKNKDGAILALAQRYDDQPQKVRKISLLRGTVPGAVATGPMAPSRYRSRYRTEALHPLHLIEIRLNDLSADDNRSGQAGVAIYPGALSAPGIHESQKRTRQSSEGEEKD